jgi:hypothetical protein
MEMTDCHETSVNNYQSPLPNKPDQRRSYLHRNESLKWRICQIICVDQKYGKKI